MTVLDVRRRACDLPRTGRDARRAIRSGEFTGQTAGVAPGYVQGNLAILPEGLAADFLRFCQLNPKPCPLLATSSPGDFGLPTLADDLDIRTDISRYRVFRRGVLVDEPTDIRGHWRDDLVVFVLGCSFSFEEALVEAGIELRHMTPENAIRAIQITTRFPAVHGAPVHIAKPELIGISNLMQPDYGDAVPIKENEIPVFWACGVTPQSVVAIAKPEFCVTHYPGCMLVTDRRNAEFAIM